MFALPLLCVAAWCVGPATVQGPSSPHHLGMDYTPTSSWNPPVVLWSANRVKMLGGTCATFEQSPQLSSLAVAFVNLREQ